MSTSDTDPQHVRKTAQYATMAYRGQVNALARPGIRKVSPILSRLSPHLVKLKGSLRLRTRILYSLGRLYMRRGIYLRHHYLQEMFAVRGWLLQR